MKPVYQTKQHKPPEQNGNCFAACVASIMELPVEDVPNFEDMPGKSWWKGVLDFAHERGLEACYITFNHDGEQCRIHPSEVKHVLDKLPKGYSIASGASYRGDWDHCVVWRDGEIVFDPQPISKPLKNYIDWIWFEPIETAHSPVRVIE